MTGPKVGGLWQNSLERQVGAWVVETAFDAKVGGGRFALQLSFPRVVFPGVFAHFAGFDAFDGVVEDLDNDLIR